MQQQKVTVHGFVSGRVQGVFFRAETCRKAGELELDGWVKNCPDGRVEFLARGNRGNIQQLQEWLRLGPRLARVDELVFEQVDSRPARGFRITD